MWSQIMQLGLRYRDMPVLYAKRFALATYFSCRMFPCKGHLGIKNV